jgi:hypothetical protein
MLLEAGAELEAEGLEWEFLLCRTCDLDVTTNTCVLSERGNCYCEKCCLVAAEILKAGKDGGVEPSPIEGFNLLEDGGPVVMAERCPLCGELILPEQTECRCHAWQALKKLKWAGQERLAKPRRVREPRLTIARSRRQTVVRRAKGNNWIESVAGSVMAMGITGMVACVVVGLVAVVGYAAWALISPSGPFDDYPTVRVAAVQQILGDIAQGTDQGYEKAFQMVSFRVRFTGNKHEDVLYKTAFKQMHDDFVMKYGANWVARAHIESSIPGSAAEIVPYKVTIDGDVYHVDAQVQISSTDSLQGAMSNDVYPENGKRHFGVLGIEEYSAHPMPKVDIEKAREFLNDKLFGGAAE